MYLRHFPTCPLMSVKLTIKKIKATSSKQTNTTSRAPATHCFVSEAEHHSHIMSRPTLFIASPFPAQAQAHFIPSGMHEPAQETPKPFFCMMPNREGARAHALWPSGQVKVLCTESRLDESSLSLSSGLKSIQEKSVGRERTLGRDRRGICSSDVCGRLCCMCGRHASVPSRERAMACRSPTLDSPWGLLGVISLDAAKWKGWWPVTWKNRGSSPRFHEYRRNDEKHEGS